MTAGRQGASQDQLVEDPPPCDNFVEIHEVLARLCYEDPESQILF